MSRRGENIFKRKDGRWEGRYICGRHKNGHTKYKSIYAHSYAECSNKLRLAKCGLLLCDNPITVSELFDAWLLSRKNNIKQTTYASYRNKWLKEFILANPPDFPISNKCCEFAKKKPAKRIIKELDADLDMTGIRKAEGGIRSAAFKTCFSECKSKGCDTFRPIFWYTDKDKHDYEQMFDVTHSRCYTEYGLRRTGCVGCPFSKHINEELAVIEEHEPNLYKAAVNIFGKSYEYTAKYRAFVKEMKAREKEKKQRGKLLGNGGAE